jgi:hypothetical protein
MIARRKISNERFAIVVNRKIKIGFTALRDLANFFNGLGRKLNSLII